LFSNLYDRPYSAVWSRWRCRSRFLRRSVAPGARHGRGSVLG
jgi:hypothetical protein